MAYADYGETVCECGCIWDMGTWFPCPLHIALTEQRHAVQDAEAAAHREAYARSFPPLHDLYTVVHGAHMDGRAFAAGDGVD